MKIVNRKKFVKSMGITLLIMIGMLLLLINNTFSKGEVKYKQEAIMQGETLWSIAEKEINSNSYFKEKDIRIIVNEIKQINHLENKTLQEGEKILIPTI